MDGGGDEVPTVAAVYQTAEGGVRTIGVAILGPRNRADDADQKTRFLHLYQFIEEGDYVWLQRLLHGSQIAQAYIADVQPRRELERLKEVCVPAAPP